MRNLIDDAMTIGDPQQPRAQVSSRYQLEWLARKLADMAKQFVQDRSCAWHRVDEKRQDCAGCSERNEIRLEILRACGLKKP